MTKEEFDAYKFTPKTEVKYDGRWHNIIGVYCDSGVFGFTLDYRDSKGNRQRLKLKDIEDIRESDDEEPTPENIDKETIEKIKNRIKMHEEMIEELKRLTK